ncbi:MAG: LURP-one-related family protein [Anaerolineae bacterium]
MLRGRRDDVGGPGPARGGGPGGPNRYQMREKLASIGDDFWIEDGAGRRVFKVDGKALRVRDTLKIRDATGREVAEIQEKLVTIRDTMDIGRDGRTIATVKKALVTPLRSRFDVNVAGGADMTVQGNITDHQYDIEQGGRKVAEVSKAWFRVRDTYGVEIQPGQDDALILAITVVVDQLSGIG